MGDGYNFQQLRDAITKLSRGSEWEVVKREWKLVGVTESEEPETCPCGHFPIIELCTIYNIIMGHSIDVGNVCVKRFLGLQSDLIFRALKRIRKDTSKSLGADATAFFYSLGIINSWEYSFQQSTMRKRNVTFKQMQTRKSINEKVLASVRRRGIS